MMTRADLGSETAEPTERVAGDGWPAQIAKLDSKEAENYQFRKTSLRCRVVRGHGSNRDQRGLAVRVPGGLLLHDARSSS